MYYLIKKYLKHETIWRQNVLLKQKVVLISREVIEQARQRDEQTEVLTEVRTRFQGPQYVLPLTMALLTSYTVNARYAEPAFGRLTTRAIIQHFTMVKFLHLGIGILTLPMLRLL